MAESSVNYFRQRVLGRSLKVTRQPDLAYFAAEFKVTLRYLKMQSAHPNLLI